MKKFLVLYSIAPAVMDEWMAKPAAERKSAEEEMSRDIRAWLGGRSKPFSDPGAGLGRAIRITAQGSAEARNALVMYAIVKGSSKEAVAKDFAKHPHLRLPEASIEVMELFPLPD